MRRAHALWHDAISALGLRLGINVHGVAKHSVTLTAGHGVNVLRSLVTGYLVVRLMPKDMYGEYQFLVSMFGTVGALTLAGLPTAVSKSIAQQGNDAPLRWTLAVYAFFCALAALSLVGIIPFLHVWQRQELWPALLLAALCFVPSNAGVHAFGGIVRGRGDFGLAFRFTLITGVLVATCTLLMLWLYPSSLLLFLCVTGIPALVSTVGALSYLSAYKNMRADWSVLKYGLQLTLATLPVSLSWYLDKLLVSHYFGLKQLAVFSVAIALPEQLKTWGKELLPVAFRKQAQLSDSPAVRRKLAMVSGFGMLVVGTGVLAYIGVSPWVLPLLFPLYLADMPLILSINALAALSLLAMPLTLFVQFLEAQGRVRALTEANWVAAVVFVAALLVCVPLWGLMGAVAARGLFRFAFGGYAAWCVCFGIHPARHA